MSCGLTSVNVNLIVLLCGLHKPCAASNCAIVCKLSIKYFHMKNWATNEVITSVDGVSHWKSRNLLSKGFDAITLQGQTYSFTRLWHHFVVALSGLNNRIKAWQCFSSLLSEGMGLDGTKNWMRRLRGVVGEVVQGRNQTGCGHCC